MRTAATLVAAAVAAAGAIVAPSADSNRAAPTLKVVTKGLAASTIAVSGAGFVAGERITLTARTHGTPRRVVTANGRGAFTTRLRGVLGDGCGGYTVVAVGARGDRAAARVKEPPCVTTDTPPGWPA